MDKASATSTTGSTAKAEKKPLLQYCESAVASLQAQYQMTKVIVHGSSMGSVREAILRDFLAAHLPDMATAMSGVVFDSNDVRSRQQDIVFALKSFPRLPFASDVDLIYVEAVIACIEIKTTISAKSWGSGSRNPIGKNLASVRALTPATDGSAVFGDLDWDERRIFSAVVTYGGSALKDMCAAISERPEVEWPDVYLDFSKGMLIQNHGLLLARTGGAAFIEINEPAVAFATFITFLTRITGRLVMRSVKWEHYLK